MLSKTKRWICAAALCLCFFCVLAYVADVNKDEKMLIEPVALNDMHIKFSDNAAVDCDQLNFGSKVLRIGNLDRSVQIQVCVHSFSGGKMDVVWTSAPLIVSQESNYFNFSISDGTLTVSQFGDNKHPEVVVAYNVEDCCERRYETCAFNWLNTKEKWESDVVCFRFFGSESEELQTIDLNKTAIEDLTDSKVSGFAVLLKLWA